MSRDRPRSPLSHIYIILVEPQTPGNIGSVARAMKNFGLHHLVLIRPCDHLSDEARWMAVHAEDILQGSVIFESLAEGLKGIHFSMATTNRKRDTHFPSFTPKEAAEKILEISKDKNVALVFGRERTGLTNEEIHLCSTISTIPTFHEQTSINLAQAVLIYAYELFQTTLFGNPNFVWDYAEADQMEILYKRIQSVLSLAQFESRKTLEDFMLGVRRVFGRTPFEDRDVRLFHKIFQEIEFFLKRNSQR